jgi:flagellar biosynthetic protein FlhB
MLYTNVEVGEQIPAELYPAVAEVLAYVYHIREQKGGGSS